MTHENIYAIATGTDDEPRFHYVGQTKKTIEERFAEHVKGARGSLSNKPLYEVMRNVGIDDFRIVLLDTTECGLHESDYVRTLIEAGHPLQNANLGNAKITKARDYSWRDINREAMARTSEHRRNRLHGESQNLTKPELVRQRVTGEIPTAEELDAMLWVGCPPELLPFGKTLKNTDKIRAEYCKFGDLILMIAWRKGGYATYLKNQRTVQATSKKATWCVANTGTTRLMVLHRELDGLPKCTWWPIGQSHRD